MCSNQKLISFKKQYLVRFFELKKSLVSCNLHFLFSLMCNSSAMVVRMLCSLNGLLKFDHNSRENMLTVLKKFIFVSSFMLDSTRDPSHDLVQRSIPLSSFVAELGIICDLAGDQKGMVYTKLGHHCYYLVTHLAAKIQSIFLPTCAIINHL